MLLAMERLPDLDLVAGIGADAVHVDGGCAGNGDIDAIGRLVAVDDGAVRATAIAVQAEFAALEGDRSGRGAIGTAERERILGNPECPD